MINTRRSKLHRTMRTKLKLSKLGFKSEKWIGHYRVDEVNYDYRIIIEINGDAVHGNPSVYNSTDVLPYGITASEKWEQDAKRKKFLEEHNWFVIVIWESDDLKIKRKLLKTIIETRKLLLETNKHGKDSQVTD